MATKAADKDAITEPTPGSTENPAGTAGIPPTPSGKGERRLFATKGNEKEWLTKGEAEKKGMFWNDKVKDS